MPSEALVLAFDTSAAHCAAALLSGDRILLSRTEDMAKGQAERLIPLLEEILTEAGYNWSDLAAIGVGTGPGNFTGIRIAVSAARGLALGLGIPAIGVSSLEAQVYGTTGVTVSSLDARRGMMYVKVFEPGQTGAPILCDLSTLPAIPARAEPTCIGHRAQDIAKHCAGQAAEPAVPLVEAIAHIASARRHSDTARPAPLYIRPADAAPARDAPPVILA